MSWSMDDTSSPINNTISFEDQSATTPFSDTATTPFNPSMTPERETPVRNRGHRRNVSLSLDLNDDPTDMLLELFEAEDDDNTNFLDKSSFKRALFECAKIHSEFQESADQWESIFEDFSQNGLVNYRELINEWEINVEPRDDLSIEDNSDSISDEEGIREFLEKGGFMPEEDFSGDLQLEAPGSPSHSVEGAIEIEDFVRLQSDGRATVVEGDLMVALQGLNDVDNAKTLIMELAEQMNKLSDQKPEKVDNDEVAVLQEKISHLEQSRNTLMQRLEITQIHHGETEMDRKELERERQTSRIYQKEVVDKEIQIDALRGTLRARDLKYEQMQEKLQQLRGTIQEQEKRISVDEQRKNTWSKQLTEHQLNAHKEQAKRKQLENEVKTLRQENTTMKVEVHEIKRRSFVGSIKQQLEKRTYDSETFPSISSDSHLQLDVPVISPRVDMIIRDTSSPSGLLNSTLSQSEITGTLLSDIAGAKSPTDDLSHWTSNDIQIWLIDQGWGQYSETFSNFTLQSILNLNERILGELGVARKDISKLLETIGDLQDREEILALQKREQICNELVGEILNTVCTEEPRELYTSVFHRRPLGFKVAESMSGLTKVASIGGAKYSCTKGSFIYKLNGEFMYTKRFFEVKDFMKKATLPLEIVFARSSSSEQDIEVKEKLRYFEHKDKCEELKRTKPKRFRYLGSWLDP